MLLLLNSAEGTFESNPEEVKAQLGSLSSQFVFKLNKLQYAVSKVERVHKQHCVSGVVSLSFHITVVINMATLVMAVTSFNTFSLPR